MKKLAAVILGLGIFGAAGAQASDWLVHQPFSGRLAETGCLQSG